MYIVGGNAYSRPLLGVLVDRLKEERRFLQVLAGPRQTGKTTLARQAMDRVDVPVEYGTADAPSPLDPTWIETQWERGRLAASGAGGALLVLDEVQKVGGWSEVVKRLWDEDTAAGTQLKVLLLGSAPLLVQRGLTESLAGRFELIRVSHWSLEEMRDAFGFTLEQFVYFGGYPGAAPLVGDEDRWRRYIFDSLIETTIARDILLMTRVDKPALLRQLFRLGCDYSAQVLSYQKMLGQLQDAGNTTTLAHYLELLEGAGMVAGLKKYSGARARQRGSSPKLLALNTALVSAMSGVGFDQARADPGLWGRLVESTVGAHLVNTASPEIEVLWWRERDREVDFVLRRGRRVVAIEVTSGRRKTSLSGLEVFGREFGVRRKLLVGGQGISVEELLERPAAFWAR